MENILITGGAGFIGSGLVDVLLEKPNLKITVLDNFDPFYSPAIKKKNIQKHLEKPNYTFIKADIRNINRVKVKLSPQYNVIIHLAAKVGVKPSLLNPLAYTEVNVIGTQNMLELARSVGCKKFIFASSSSVYGVNQHVPWDEDDHVLLPISPYAATKISGELLGHVYSHLFNFQFLGLRFFSVYGPRQRPDLVIHKFTQLIIAGKPIKIYGNGNTKRDYTYIDDIVEGIVAALEYSNSQYEIFNLGNNKPVELNQLIGLLEDVLKKKAIVERLPEQPGDVPLTVADITKAQKLLGYEPKTPIITGLKRFTEWFTSQHNAKMK